MGGSILRRQDWFFPLNQNRWQAAVKVDKLYGDPIGAQAPAIAVVDSGVDATVPDFGGRVVTQVNLDSRNEGESGDNFGHGTMVAGVAAGAAMTLPGAAPKAKIVSVRTSNANNESLVSDVIAAAQWIKANKDAYGIRVANFSLLAAAPSSFVWDPLDQALEQLWFSGVVVVAASGNLGPVPMDYAPANDPFVIVVGATDTGNDAMTGNDEVAPFSSYGRSHDGFARPDVVAPGRYMVAPVPANASLKGLYPQNVVSGAYMRLSGTSFAAPAVAGIAALILAKHPEWTPDQVKGALMQTTNRSTGTFTRSRQAPAR